MNPTPEQITILHHLLTSDLKEDPSDLSRDQWVLLWGHLEELWRAGKLTFLCCLFESFKRVATKSGGDGE